MNCVSKSIVKLRYDGGIIFKVHLYLLRYPHIYLSLWKYKQNEW